MVPLGLVLIGAGVLLVYSGIADPPGGIAGVLGPLLRGEGLPKLKEGPTRVSYAASPSAGIVAVGGGGGSGAAAGVVAYGRAQLGKPYKWAGAGPAVFDCSGLTMRAVQAGMGITLPHNAHAQQVSKLLVTTTTPAPGDLVFFGRIAGHCGIYIGGGQMIHAPQTGDVVKVAPVAGRSYTEYRTYKAKPKKSVSA